MALTQISTAGVKDDAVTAGKIPANAVGSSELADNAVDNAAVASNAAIAGTKISPDFGSQNIATTGNIAATGELDVGGNIDVNGSPPWSVAGGNYANISLSGNDGSSSGFIYMGSGAATTNADFDLGRINFLNNTTITSQIVGSTQTGANDDGRLTFGTKATGGSLTERMRIDSSGSVLVGATSYGGGGTSPDVYISSTSGRQLKIHNTNSSTSSLQLTNAATGQGDDNGLQIAALSDGTAYFNQVESAPMRFDVNGSERMRIQSGGGISFNGDTAAANALDDYEEGTFTPRLGPNLSMSTIHENGVGRYTKVGNMVTCTMHWINKNGTAFPGNQTIRIDSLPYTIKHVGNNNSAHYIAMSQMMYNIQFGQQDKHYFYSSNNTTYLTGLKSRDNTSWQDWSTSDWDQSQIYFNTSITYMTN